MQPLHIKMTWEEYLVHPRKLGWKHEYMGGTLYLSPSWTAVATYRIVPGDFLRRETHSCVQRPPVASIRSLLQQDLIPLLELFCECFENGIDYADNVPSDLMHYAQKSLLPFFPSDTQRNLSMKDPDPSPYLKGCRVAVLRGHIIGCSMIADRAGGPILQPIFVAPNAQRRGVATQLLFASCKYLADHGIGELRSQCSLGNEASTDWHIQCGFEEIPSDLVAGHRANIYEQEAERQELLKLPTAQAMRDLAEWWAKEWKRLAMT